MVVMIDFLFPNSGSLDMVDLVINISVICCLCAT